MHCERSCYLKEKNAYFFHNSPTRLKGDVDKKYSVLLCNVYVPNSNYDANCVPDKKSTKNIEE